MAALTQANLGGRTIELTQMTTQKQMNGSIFALFMYMMLSILMTLKNNVLFPNVKPQTVKHAIF
jgi:hypothetical protein